MANLFDQYLETERGGRQTLPSSQNRNVKPSSRPEKISSEEVPIFTKSKINFQAPAAIGQMTVCNNQLILGLSNSHILRIDLENPDQRQDIDLSESVDNIRQVFQDPTGNHVLIVSNSGEGYYLGKHGKKARHLSKFKGHVITSVGWNVDHSTDSSTGPILIGTKQGSLLEAELISQEEGRLFSHSSTEQYVKELYTVKGDKDPISGIQMIKLASSTAAEYRYAILVTTTRRLYQFIGSIPSTAESPVFKRVFSKYEESPERFQELPGSADRSCLLFINSTRRQRPANFAWTAAPGVYAGSIDVSGSQVADSVTVNTQLISYPELSDNSDCPPPTDAVLTDFHILLLHNDRLRVMCILNEQLIDEEVFSDRNTWIQGLCRDSAKGTLWAFSRNALFKFKIVKETRDVWKMFLEQGNFALAKEYSRDNPKFLDEVVTREAEQLFEQKQYEASAALFAQSQASFEEVALKFIHVTEQGALRQYLRTKLFSLKPQEQTQRTLLVTWLIELYLTQLGQLRERTVSIGSEPITPTTPPHQMDPFLQEEVKEEFIRFLKSSELLETLSNIRNTVYDLIASHGDKENLVFFAHLIKDYKRVITHYLQREQFEEALHTLENQPDIELYYSFSPQLMQQAPSQTVALWLKQADRLEPRRLIPALCAEGETQGNEAIRYLEFCTRTLHTREQAIHNYLLSLYARLKPDKLVNYLEYQGLQASDVCYDLKYALRVCSERGLVKACVHIYSVLGLYTEAVDLALENNDFPLARTVAGIPQDNNELTRKLWLRLAAYVVRTKEDVEAAMELLHDCPLLRIEDILPFFPDFVTIDHFKEALCGALREHSQQIGSLQNDMDEAAQAAQQLRTQIQDTKHRCWLVQPSDHCASCQSPLFSAASSFYVFPCKHKLHEHCLVQHLLPELTTRQQQEVTSLQQQLESTNTSAEPGADDSRVSAAARTKAKLRLHEILASECVFCADYMIRDVDSPFIPPAQLDAVNESWL